MQPIWHIHPNLSNQKLQKLYTIYDIYIYIYIYTNTVHDAAKANVHDCTSTSKTTLTGVNKSHDTTKMAMQPAENKSTRKTLCICCTDALMQTRRNPTVNLLVLRIYSSRWFHIRYVRACVPHFICTRDFSGNLEYTEAERCVYRRAITDTICRIIYY